MEQVIFFAPRFFEKMWGGTKLTEQYPYSYKVNQEPLGEIWGFADHVNGVSVVRGGKYDGMSLHELWLTQSSLFGFYTSPESHFPFQLRLVDAKRKLSVQVHPDDVFAHEFAGDNGKHEAWYVLDAETGSKIIYGHSAVDAQQFLDMVNDERWKDLLCEIPVRQGDFIYVPAGMLHAIGAGNLVLEVAQNSDTTYRFYDYERLDTSGTKRELHMEQAKRVTTVPAKYPVMNKRTEYYCDAVLDTFMESEFFTVQKLSVGGDAVVAKANAYLACFVVSGSGTLQGSAIGAGDFLLLTAATKQIEASGNFELVMVYKQEVAG
ncbi:type I phosphomannose isomerase catalytic subunit [Culicoidibacter larvae]|uniref:Phosphohexomutase n=1 Tax=Culicoidibacter larvae TaxID=2579976 RepID=A0A5R8Q9X9_9FIRM|nr:type I phosphomannose isomerase catalytic subunit [Culicoidibacter larvae]TLG72734.1 mannose-6-phosphate isomerase [Culicoidibacter larvae]